MANELKTTLELDIKPFLDAIKKAANQISTLQELRPKFNTTEFQNLQRQISGFKPNINVAVVVDKRSLDAVENEINTIGTDPLNLEVLVNSEEILTSVERIRQLRSTALNIPAKTNVKLDTNAETVSNDFIQVKKTVESIEGEYTIEVDSNEPEVTKQLDAIQTNVKTLTAEDYQIVLDVDTQALQKSLAEIPSFIRPGDLPISSEQFARINFEIDKLANNFEAFRQKLSETDIGAEIARGADVGDLISEDNVAQFERVFDLLNQLKENRDLTFDFNADELAAAIGVLRNEFEQFGISIADIDNIQLDSDSIKRYALAFLDAQDKVKQLNDELIAVNKQKLQDIFPGIEQSNRGLLDSAARITDIKLGIEAIEERARTAGIIDFKINENAKREILDVADTIKEIPSVRDIFIDVVNDEEFTRIANAVKNFADKTINFNVEGIDDSENDVDSFKNKLQNIPYQRDTKVNVQDVPESIKELNQVEKELNDLPNQKNIKLNVDQTGVNNISKATGAIGGFTKQVSSGLLASFSGAAIGAAIAGFATQAVRGIGQAVKTADELQDSLILAFTQAGVADIEQALQRANVFALDLSNNFGISAERSKTLLSQVVGLTGEFGSASENITKAAIGIESATGGLVKAEQAAKLFSRSIGNPEDQAALETLAKRFPAIGDAILGATEPAEKANAVITNLSGTFAALNEDSQDLFSTLQRLGDTFSTVFGTAFAPIADSLAPVFQRISDSLLENTDSIAAFGDKIVTSFIEPLLDQLEKLGPSFDTLLTGITPTLGVISGISFDVLITALQILDPLLQAVGLLFTAINPLLQTLGDIVSGVLTPVFQLFNNELTNSLDPTKQLTDNVFTLAPIMETLSNIVSLLNPVLNLLGKILIATVIPALQGLEYVLGVVLLPFRALNFAFDVGAKFASDYGDQISKVASAIQNYILPLIPPLFIASKLLGAIFDYANTPINFKVNLGDLSKIGNVPADVFGEQFDAAKQFEEQLGVRIPKALSKFGKGFGGASKESKKNTEATKENISALQKLIERYQTFNKLLQDNADVRELQATAQEADLEAGLKRQLTDYEKIFREQTKINEAKEDQRLLEQNFAKELGISADNIKKFAEAYLRSGDLAALPIFFDAKDQKSVQDAQKVADEFVKLYKSSIETKTQEQELKLKFETAKIEINQQAIATQLGDVETFLNRQLQQLEFGQISVADLNIDGVKNSLIAIRDSAQESLKPFADRLASVKTEIANTISRITELKKANGDNSEEIKKQEYILGDLQNRYNVLTSQQKVYQDSVDATTEKLNNLGQTIEQAVNQRFDRLSRFETLELNLDLNAEDVNQGLIDIQNGFINAANEIRAQFEIARKLIESQEAPAGIANLGLDKLAEAEKNALQNLQAQRILAIREFQKQNNAIFAIAESFRTNFAGAVAPDNTRAKKAFDERKEEINNELDLLKTNLDLQVITYQEYNEKVLELEREKRDAIKEYDKEVEQNRLDGFKRLAEDALPAINKQLEVASAELTVLLNNNASDFTDIANKSLENLALVGAQSLGIALQQAQSLEEVQKLFIKSLVRNTLQALQVQLVGAILQGIFRDVEKAGTLGLITGALISGALTALFLKAEQEILKLAGFESGGYTGDVGTKDVAGVVHGQEYVVNAKNTRENRPLLDWINKGNSAESFFKNSSPDVSVDNYVDTKAINSSINTLAYTMDARLSSLETTVDRAIRQNATLTKSANQLDVSVYSDPGTAIKYMKRMGKIKGLS